MRIEVDFNTTSVTFGYSQPELLEGVREVMRQVSRKTDHQLQRRPCACKAPEGPDVIYDRNGRRIGTIVITLTEDENATLYSD